MAAVLDIAIIGCGTAGPAAALYLARAGHRVTIYERVPSPGPVGAGIVLQPTGMSVLAELGLFDEIVARGARLDGLRCVTHRGRRVVDIAYADLSPSLYGAGMHRGVLFEHLAAAVAREPNVTVRTGVGVEDLRPARHGRQWLVGEGTGERHGPHQLVIVADGARSRLRDDTDVAKQVVAYPWGALWFIAEDRERRFTRRLSQVVRRADRMLGFLPTGLGPGTQTTTPYVSLYWSMRGSEVEAWRASGAGGLAAWKEEILTYVPEADRVLAQIADQRQVLHATYHDVRMSPWNTDSVVYLGDAAHAMSPQLGQGANLALWDAMILARCLAARAGDGSVGAALDHYSRRRRRHLGFYQFATRWLTPFFQSDYLALGLLRDLFLGSLTRVPFAARLMVRAMAGVASWPFGGAIDLPAPLPAFPAPPAAPGDLSSTA